MQIAQRDKSASAKYVLFKPSNLGNVLKIRVVAQLSKAIAFLLCFASYALLTLKLPLGNTIYDSVYDETRLVADESSRLLENNRPSTTPRKARGAFL